MAVEARAEYETYRAPHKTMEAERACESVSAMTDLELLLFGIATKLGRSPRAPAGAPTPGALEAQLAQARREWNRRHPSLPLVDSF